MSTYNLMYEMVSKFRKDADKFFVAVHYEKTIRGRVFENSNLGHKSFRRYLSLFISPMSHARGV